MREVDREPEPEPHGVADHARELDRAQREVLVAPRARGPRRCARDGPRGAPPRRRLRRRRRARSAAQAARRSRRAGRGSADERSSGSLAGHDQHAAAVADLERAEIRGESAQVALEHAHELRAVAPLERQLTELEQHAGLGPCQRTYRRPPDERLLVFVERLARQLGAARAEQAHLDVVARVGVERDEREALLDQRALVGGGRPELGGGRHAVGHERHAPDQRDHAAPALGAAPVADLLVGQVERPVRVLRGRLLREVGRGVEVGGLGALVLARVGHVAEHLAAALGRRGGGHVGAPAQVRSGNQADLADARSPLGAPRSARRAPRPAPVGQRLLRRLGGEQRDLARDGRHGARGKLHARVAQPRRRVLGRQHVQVHAGADLEAGELGQARHHLDAPAEVLGVARGGAHPHVERRQAPPSTARSRASTSCSSRPPSGPSSANRAPGGAARPGCGTARARRTGRARPPRRRPPRCARGARTSSCTRSSSRLRPCVRCE